LRRKTPINPVFSKSSLTILEMAQRIARLSSKSSLLLLCDMQEKFRPTIKYFPQIIETSNKLLQACKILDVPYVVTEQYPKGSHYQQIYESILFYFK